MSPTAVLESTEWPSFVCSSLAVLRQEGVLCDTTLLGKNGRTLLAHSCILAAASPVLRTIVTQQNLVSFLHKTDFISRGVWDVILEFIYRGKVTIDTVTDAHDIMVAAEKLELEKLRSLCEDFLHIEGAILKDSVTPIVLDENEHTDVPVIKTEPGLSPTSCGAQNVHTEIDAASYASGIPPGMVQSSNPEVSTSVRIKTEPIDDTFDKQSASDSVLTSGDGSGHVLSGSQQQKDVGRAITNQPMQTEAPGYRFITHASPLVSSSMPVSQPMGSMREWSTAPNLSGRVPVTIPLTIPVTHKLPVILPDTAEAMTVTDNITQRLPLTRALLSTTEPLTTSNSALQLTHAIGDNALTTQLSPSDGHDNLPALVTMDHTNVTNSAVTTGCSMDTSSQSITYSLAMAASSMPVSSTVEDEGPLCLVMPKKKPVAKTRRKRRPVVVRPEVPPMSSAADPPSFQTPSLVSLEHPTPTTGAYPTSVSSQYQQPGGQPLPVGSHKHPPPSTDLCPAITPYGVWRNSELRRRLATRQCTQLGTVTALGAAEGSLDPTTGDMSPSSIAQAEVPDAAVPHQVVAPSDEASEKMSEGRSMEDQRAKEQIAIEVISQLSGAYNEMGRGRRKKITATKRRHPNHNGFLPTQRGPKLTIKLKTPKRQSSCSLSPVDISQQIPESALEQNDSSLQRCNVVMYDTTAVEPGTTLDSVTHNDSTCLPVTVLDTSQLTVRSVMKLYSPRMSEERQLMRPWLEMQLRANTVPGLHWMNEEQTLARIPWLHASRTSYQMDTDSCLFMMWAEHTGKYVPGRDEPDPKRWKANFRCALNSLADVLEVKDSSQKRGREAFKVYKFLPQTKKSRRHSTPHTNSGRKKKEDANSSGGETDGVKTVRRRLVSPELSDTPSNILTGREIMSVMKRKGGVIDTNMSVEDSVSATVASVAAAAVSVVQSHHNCDVTLKPDSTSSMVPFPDVDTGSREVGDVPTSVSPSEPAPGSHNPCSHNHGSQTAVADTSTHCVVDTDIHKTLTATAQWSTTDQPFKETVLPAAGLMRSQTGFSCKDCSQWFTHSTMLARHQLSHTASMKTHKDIAGLGCMAGGNQGVEQKPMET